MKKAIVGLGAIAAGVGLFLARRRVSQEMREHAKQMKAHCKEMMANPNGGDVPSSEVEESRRTEGAAAPSTPGA